MYKWNAWYTNLLITILCDSDMNWDRFNDPSIYVTGTSFELTDDVRNMKGGWQPVFILNIRTPQYAKAKVRGYCGNSKLKTPNGALTLKLRGWLYLNFVCVCAAIVLCGKDDASTEEKFCLLCFNVFSQFLNCVSLLGIDANILLITFWNFWQEELTMIMLKNNGVIMRYILKLLILLPLNFSCRLPMFSTLPNTFFVYGILFL